LLGDRPLSDSSQASTSRRRFVQQTAAFSLLYSSRRSLAQMQGMQHDMHPSQDISPNAPGARAPMLHVLELPPFVDALPTPEPTPQATPHKLRIAMREIHAKVHRDLPPTRMWSYGPIPLAPIVEARSGHPLQIEWVNNLPTRHFLPIDHSLHGCGHDVPDVRTVTHVHGAKVPSKDDGYPDDWFVPGKSRICHYPNQQDAATLWYHDHAMGLNRLSTYAGLVGLYFIRDKVEDSLQLPAGKYEVPLVLYDRNFTTDGQLFYATSGDPEHPWIPEFSADGIVINGKLRPFFEVEPHLYRFRVLNAANSRFFALSLSDQRPLVQIGSDQGLLSTAADVRLLVLAPAERADFLLDFTQSAGQTLHLRTGALDILEFRVAKQSTSPASSSIPVALRTIERTPESSATFTRTITLNEYQDKITNPMIMLLNRKRWHESVTETPRLNSTEIWEFVNQTEDTHPMHLHLVRFQLLDRRTFDTFDYLMNKHLRFTAPAEPPAPNELGWKDTIQCPPGMITRIIVRFEGYAGKYLYHCHILEHEANDMMRPFEVIS
jgi:spore coat protein A, manganese oxidase